MTEATATARKPVSDRGAEFQAALDEYILDYRRSHKNLQQPATGSKDSKSRVARGARVDACARTVLTGVTLVLRAVVTIPPDPVRAESVWFRR
jgi:translation elongation factor EF-G